MWSVRAEPSQTQFLGAWEAVGRQGQEMMLFSELSHATHLGAPKTTQEPQISALTGGTLV